MDRERETLATVELFSSWGVAVFPAGHKEKGTRVEGWPEIPASAAAKLCRQEARRRVINIAARTGLELAVIDLDGKGDVRPDQALARLLYLLPQGVAVSKTHRGFHVFSGPPASWATASCPATAASCSAPATS